MNCRNRGTVPRRVSLSPSSGYAAVGLIVLVGCFWSGPAIRANEGWENPPFRVEYAELASVVLRSLDRKSMNSIDTAPSDIDVQLMIGSDGIGRTYLVVANPMPWTETIELRWASSWPTDPTPLGKTAELRWELPGPEGPSSPMPPSRSTPPNWRFDLPANSNAAWRFSEPTIAIGEWDHRIQASMQRRLEESLDRLALSLTQLTQFQPLENTPANGSFEAPLQKDPKLPKDWALSLTPAAAWSRQTTLVRSGDFSLNYRTDRRDGSGWLQSPPIELPSDGKISASLWYRIPHAPPPPNSLRPRRC